MTNTVPKVFISYAHESTELSAAVFELAEWLRNNKGIHVTTDHPFVNRAPESGWRGWMQHCVEDSDWVLIVCTPKYKASFEKRDAEQPEGFGRTWEAAIITQELYESKLQNAKYIPILPDGGRIAAVPVVLRDFCNQLQFPRHNDRIADAIIEAILDPNAKLPEFQHRPLGQLTTEDARLIADQNDVFGRETEIEQVLTFLRSSQNATQLVAQLTGTGGIGKTEVCKRSIKLWLQQNPEARVYWVSISDGASAAECALEIARALGYTNLEKPEHLFPLIKAGLYYLDNLESLDSLEGNIFLRKLLEHPGVRILASSRVNLAALGKPISIDKLPEAAAITTFVEAWTGEDDPQKHPEFNAFITNDLGCHPLSLVLVAALGAEQAIDKLIHTWHQIGTDLANQEHDPTRRGNLAVSLQLSSNQLSQESGSLMLWTIAALFPNGIENFVIEEIYKSKSLISNVSLKNLIRHNILKRKGDIYYILPPVARFALDQAKREMLGFSWLNSRSIISPILLKWVESANHKTLNEKNLSSKEIVRLRLPTLHRYLLEDCNNGNANLTELAKFNFALLNQYSLNLALGKEILDALSKRFSMNADFQVHYATTLKKLGDFEKIQGNTSEAKKFYINAIKIFQRVSPVYGLTNTLLALGDLELRSRNIPEARGLFDKAFRLYHDDRDDLGKANTLAALGTLENSLDNIPLARQLLKDAIEIYRTRRHDLGLANTYIDLGELEKRQGKVENAKQCFNISIELFKKLQDSLHLAKTLLSLGGLESQLGNIEQAEIYFTDSIKLFRNEKSYINLAYGLQDLGHLQIKQGNFKKAHPLLCEALELFNKYQRHVEVALLYIDLGRLEWNRDDFPKARSLLNDAIVFFRKNIFGTNLAYALNELAELEYKQCNLKQAEDLLQEAKKLFINANDNLGLANSLKLLGHITLEKKEVNKALEIYTEALRLYQQEQAPLGTAYTAEAMLRCYFALGNQEPIASLAELALNAAQSSSITYAIEHVKRTLDKINSTNIEIPQN